MLEERYYVSDDSWENYPTAYGIGQQALKSLQNGLYTASTHIDLEPPSSLLKRILLRMGRDLSSPIHLGEQEQHLVYQVFYLQKTMVHRLQENFGLMFDTQFRETRLWYFDGLGIKRFSGLFDALFIDNDKQIGAVLKHTFDQKVLISAQSDKELEALALIATDAFNLKGVIVTSLSSTAVASDLWFYTGDSLGVVRERFQS